MSKIFIITVLLVLVIGAGTNFSGNRSSDSQMMSAYQDLLTKEEVKEVVN